MELNRKHYLLMELMADTLTKLKELDKANQTTTSTIDTLEDKDNLRRESFHYYSSKVCSHMGEVILDVEGDDEALEVSAQTKHVALQKKAAATSLVAVDFERRFESREMVGPKKDDTQEEQAQFIVKVMCRLCFDGENEEKGQGKCCPAKLVVKSTTGAAS
ncbi:hypothetical protein ACH5RR_006901 [Cinchona calisaya]|uniref:Uncharacterized protein n=1 Tax=Cinchona calisaya TaxID=153742 RepID=A0ABD3AQC8_9GENT